MRTGGRPRGFTLIELIVVILMIAVMSAILLPEYNQMVRRSEFRRIARDVEEEFVVARELAVRYDTVSVVTFDPLDAAFRIQIDMPPQNADAPDAFGKAANGSARDAAVSQQPQLPDACKLPQGYRIEEVWVSARGSAPASGLTVHFQGDGTAEAAGFRLVSDRGNSELLEVSPGLGRILRKEQ